MEAIKLTFEKAGVQFEGIPLQRGTMELDSPSGHQVDLGYAVWRKENDPAFDRHEKENAAYNAQHGVESTKQTKDKIVIVSGFGSGEIELPPWFHALGKVWNTVVALAHPDAPSSKIKAPAGKPDLANKPLNENSFANSGSVEIHALEQLVNTGIIEKGATVMAYSTGSAVMIEAAAQDAEMHPDPNDRLVKNLVLMSPAGLIDRGGYDKIAAGGAAAMKPYFSEYLRDLWHAIKKPYRATEGYNQKSISLKELAHNLLVSWKNPEWKQIRPGQTIVELVEFTASHLPISDLMAWFHRTWSNPMEFNLPHLLPDTPSLKKNRELVDQDCTEKAREKINETDIIVFLFSNDQAVPPEAFLTKEDQDSLNSLTFDDLTEQEQAATRSLNQGRLEKNQLPYSRQEILEGIKEERKADWIITRVKEKFPNNKDRVRVIISDGTHHITPKVDLDAIMQILANRVQ